MDGLDVVYLVWLVVLSVIEWRHVTKHPEVEVEPEPPPLPVEAAVTVIDPKTPPHLKSKVVRVRPRLIALLLVVLMTQVVDAQVNTVTRVPSNCTDAQVIGGQADGSGVECQTDATGGSSSSGTGLQYGDGAGGFSEVTSSSVSGANVTLGGTLTTSNSGINIGSDVGFARLSAGAVYLTNGPAAANGTALSAPRFNVATTASILGYSGSSAYVAGNNGSGVGSLMSAQSVWTFYATRYAANPAPLVNWDSGSCLSNEGATALNYYALPTAAVPQEFCFIVADADGIRVVANTGDTIQVAGDVSGTAGYCESTTIGDVATFAPINATQWFAIALVGTGWTCT